MVINVWNETVINVWNEVVINVWNETVINVWNETSWDSFQTSVILEDGKSKHCET